jgi:hypothetical protein
MIDFSKAFDRLNHNQFLIKKLQALGVHPCLINWHADFLRCQYLKARLHFFAAISSAIFVFWRMRTSRWVMNVLSTWSFIWAFITHPLLHNHQKKKIDLEIATKIASVNGP